MATSSQKFIARNRAPRVQIEYDVELYGAEKKVQLPFVMGVLSDLSGKPTEPLAPVAEQLGLRVSVMGTPAEEGGGGKITMLEGGIAESYEQVDDTTITFTIRSIRSAGFAGRRLRAAGS